MVTVVESDDGGEMMKVMTLVIMVMVSSDNAGGSVDVVNILAVNLVMVEFK